MAGLLKKIAVTAESEGSRLDFFVAGQFPACSRTRVQRCIDEGCILLNNAPAKKRAAVKAGDTVSIDERALTDAVETRLEPQEIPLDILYEDEWFIAVNKPAGMVVHPGSGNREHTLVNALLFHRCSLSAGTAQERPGIVHRLDKDTSGVIVAAKSDEAHNALAALFADRLVEKEYAGFCIGAYPKQEEIIDAPIGRRKNDPVRHSVVSKGREAATRYLLRAHHCGISMLRFFPRTGRTHQIRVHCSYRGFPIVADNLYGGGVNKIAGIQPLDRPFARKIFSCFSRHALHAARISFVHPLTNERMTVEAPLPVDFCDAGTLFESV